MWPYKEVVYLTSAKHVHLLPVVIFYSFYLVTDTSWSHYWFPWRLRQAGLEKEEAGKLPLSFFLSHTFRSVHLVTDRRWRCTQSSCERVKAEVLHPTVGVFWGFSSKLFWKKSPDVLSCGRCVNRACEYCINVHNASAEVSMLCNCSTCCCLCTVEF